MFSPGDCIRKNVSNPHWFNGAIRRCISNWVMDETSAALTFVLRIFRERPWNETALAVGVASGAGILF